MAAEITLADLLAWEPRLRIPGAGDSLGVQPVSGGANGGRAPSVDFDRELSWAVTVRASTPMLPPLRGGELILLPRRVLSESGVSLPLLLRELAGNQCCGVVLDGVPSGTSPLPLVVTSSVGPDFEGEINRLLTQRRGELYRTGTDLERLLADLASAGAELPQLLRAVSTSLALPASVTDTRGATLAASSGDAAPPAVMAGLRGWHGDRLATALGDGRTLWLGPVPRHRRALARLVGDRVASAVSAALSRAAQSRPRGPARAGAIRSLLTGALGDPLTRATALGLQTEGVFRVALGPADAGVALMQRALAPLGTVHDAGPSDGWALALVEVRPDPATSSPAARRGAPGRPESPSPRVLGLTIPDDAGWLALSAPVAGAARLPEGFRQARFITALLELGKLSGPLARFDVVDDLGAFRLLYQLWGQADLALFTADALGDLPARDRRGTLRRTLLAYLETGGSHVDAAERLGIHRNTLAYRLKQIAAFTGRDPTDPEPRLVLHLALLAATLPPAPR